MKMAGRFVNRRTAREWGEAEWEVRALAGAGVLGEYKLKGMVTLSHGRHNSHSLTSTAASVGPFGCRRKVDIESGACNRECGLARRFARDQHSLSRDRSVILTAVANKATFPVCRHEPAPAPAEPHHLLRQLPSPFHRSLFHKSQVHDR